MAKEEEEEVKRFDVVTTAQALSKMEYYLGMAKAYQDTAADRAKTILRLEQELDLLMRAYERLTGDKWRLAETTKT